MQPSWRACEDQEIQPDIRAQIQGRVVVVGEDFSDIDRHETVVGDIPGYILQANYVESLLDDRVIRPAPQLLNLLTGLMVFAGFEYLAWRYHHHRVKAFAALLVGTALIIYLSVTLLGYYLNPVTISVIAVLLRIGDLAIMPPGTPEMEKHQ